MSKKANELLKKWTDVEFGGSVINTEEFKKFSRNFKSVIKEQTEDDFNIVNFNVGHFYISGFLKSKTNEEKVVYFSISDVRYFQNDWIHRILIRTAKHEKDYTGGFNNYTNLLSFGRKVRDLV